MEFEFGPAMCFGTIGVCFLAIIIGAVVDAIPKRTKGDDDDDEPVKRAKEKMRRKFESKDYRKDKGKSDKKTNKKGKESLTSKMLDKDAPDFEALDEDLALGEADEAPDEEGEQAEEEEK